MAFPAKQPKQRKEPEQPSSGRSKWLYIGIAILLTGIVLFLPLRFRADPDANLAPEQKIHRDFRRAFDPKQSTLQRLSSLRKSFNTMRNIPPERRHPVMVEALAESVNRSILDFTRLKPEEKSERAELLRQDAERTLKFFRRFPKEKQRKALAVLANTPGGRAQLNRAIDMSTNDFTPEDRKLLGPTIKIWKTMLEDVR